MGYEELLAGADWKHAPPEWRAPREYHDGRPVVALTYVPHLPRDLHMTWLHLRAHWLALGRQACVIDALAPLRPGGVLLRYAAIDWKYAPIRAGDAAAQLALWGVQLALAFELIAQRVPADERGRFARPTAFVDLGGHARLIFSPCAPAYRDELFPPELERSWPYAGEGVFVHLVATLLATLAEDITQLRRTPLGDILGRCASRRPAERPTSLLALRCELAAIAACLGRGPREIAGGWERFEEAIGWLAIGQDGRALQNFEAALERGAQMRLSLVGRLVARDRLGLPSVRWRPVPRETSPTVALEAAARAAWRQIQGAGVAWPWYEPPPAWEHVEADGAKLEAERDFRGALALYHRAIVSPHSQLAIARCCAALHEPGYAVDYATRVLAVDPMHIEAKRIRARARLARHEPDAALGDLDALLSAEPDDAGAHYLRGKALLALSRLPEARTEFDRASALSPQLLEAMLLRREAIRRGAVARAAAGEHVQPTHDDASAATEDGDLDAQLDVAAGASDAHLAALKLRDVGG